MTVGTPKIKARQGVEFRWFMSDEFKPGSVCVAISEPPLYSRLQYRLLDGDWQDVPVFDAREAPAPRVGVGQEGVE